MNGSALVVAACISLSVAAAPVVTFAQSPAPAAAATAVTPTDAKPYLGDWTISAQSAMGPTGVYVSVKIEEGKVVTALSTDFHGPAAGFDIMKTGSSLVFRYSFDYEGNAVPAVFTGTLKDEKLEAQINIADGALEMGGVGTRTAAVAK